MAESTKQKTMLALQVRNATDPPKLEEVPIPTLHPTDVLIKVVAAGISAGVMKMVKMGRAKLPTIIGHEVGGTIEIVGQDVPASEFKPGDRVRLHPIVSCRKCYVCTHGKDQMCQESGLIGFAKFAQLSNPSQYDIYHDGGVAEYIRVPYWQLDLLPDNVSFEAAAKAHDAGVALQALKLADLPPHSTVVVTAPTGAMGAITVRLAKQFAISKLILIGRSPERLEKVKTISTVPTEIVSLIDPDIDIVDSVRKFAPQGVQAIIDYIPVGDTVSKLLPVMVTGGTLVHFGGNPAPLKVPMGAMMANCWRLISSRGNARVDTTQALKLLADGELKIDDLFTHKYPFSDAEKAVDTIENRREPMWLSIIHVS